METTTQNKQTLIERFQEVAEPPAWFSKYHPGETYYPNQEGMEGELCDLLQGEITGNYHRDFDNPEELLQVYKNTFEWETSYGLKVLYHITPGITKEVVCETPEELKEYLEGTKGVEEPSIEDYLYELECEEEYKRKPDINVSNLKLKEKFSYSLVLNVECEEEQENIASNFTDFFNQFVKGMKVVSCTHST